MIHPDRYLKLYNRYIIVILLDSVNVEYYLGLESDIIKNFSIKEDVC